MTEPEGGLIRFKKGEVHLSDLPKNGVWTPLTVSQLIGRLDVKCDEIVTYSRPSRGDVLSLVGICRRLISAYDEELRKKNEQD